MEAGVQVEVGEKRYVIEGDPREDERLFDRFADLLKAAFYESLHKGVVCVSFFEEEDESWPPTLVLSQPFQASLARFAVVLDEDKRPLFVFDLFEVHWSFVADTVLQLAAQWLGVERLSKVEIEVADRW